MTPTVLLLARQVSIKALTNVLFPAPGGPVMPMRTDMAECSYSSLKKGSGGV
ncbi:uncharacterized protein METZ01_LOCUS131821 [marine metagenome]|uniref:Uncharacterized protein n=1 Tax=marine metagenome TaxID=408172 RepID=A0A381YR37_9ZZZZ